MIPSDPRRAGSTARIFRIPGPAGSSLVLEHGSRHVDLSHGLAHARRGDLLELVARGAFEDPAQFADPARQWPAPAPTRVLTPFEPRHVGKVLALGRAPRELFEATGALDGRAWFSNRSPATLIASDEEIAHDELAAAPGPGEPGFLHHEVFLAVVVARRARGLELHAAESAIAGYMVASDFTRRTLDGRPRTPWFGESPIGALAIGPAFVPRACLDLRDVTVGARRTRAGTPEPQHSRTSGEFATDVALAVAALSRLAILHPGDLLLLPTGVGVGRVAPGDLVHCSIDGIGELSTGVGPRARLRQQA